LFLPATTVLVIRKRTAARSTRKRVCTVKSVLKYKVFQIIFENRLQFQLNIFKFLTLPSRKTNQLKILVGLLLFLSFSVYSQDSTFSGVPKKYSLGSSFQNEDIFVAMGVLYDFKKVFTFEIRLGLGARRSFFQQAMFLKTDLLFHYDLLKSRKWKFGPSLQFSNMSLTPQFLKPIQRYYSAEVGYYFAFGKQLKVTQSSYFGFRSTEFVPAKERFWFYGYAFQIGLSYEL
jgi:hypothetical protein